MLLCWIIVLVIKKSSAQQVNTNVRCPNSWFQSADSCYLYKNISKSYQDALSSCESYGGSLLSIKDKVENDFISNFISTNNLQGTDIWIGLNDIKNRAQRKFEWSDGTPISFTNWIDGEPNNYMENEDCVVLYKGWNDDVCAKNKSYICEINKDSTDPCSLCSVNAQCVTADGVRQCVCNNGFIGNGTTCAVNTNIKCPNSWFQSADSCYLYKNISKSYQDALSSCESYGGSLLSIKDKVENDFISNFISTNNLQGTDFWIGLNDIKNRAQKKFEWSDGTPLSFTNWRSGEPNNYMENEDCVVLYNGWNDDVCAKNKSYICEINTVNTNNNCPTDWLQSADSCYLYKHIERTYQDALSSCESIGGSLLSIKDKEENDFISNFINKYNLRYTIWIGLNDIKNRAQRKFEWSDGTPFSFTDWKNAEPNNIGGNEDCVAIYYGWNDEMCDKKYVYICEFNKDDPCSSCSLNAQCVTTNGVRQCACDNGFIGNGITCTVDPCSSCSLNAQCVTTNGDRQCTCDNGFIGNGITCTDFQFSTLFNSTIKATAGSALIIPSCQLTSKTGNVSITKSDIFWVKDDLFLSATDNPTPLQTAGTWLFPTLQINKATLSDNGIYQCGVQTVIMGQPVLSDKILVTIIAQTVEFASQISFQNTYNNALLFNCTYNANEDHSGFSYWLLNGVTKFKTFNSLANQTLPSLVGIPPHQFGHYEVPALHIMSYNMTGLYQCVVFNNKTMYKEFKSNVFNIPRQPDPIFLNNPILLSANLNSINIVGCSFYTYFELKYGDVYFIKDDTTKIYTSASSANYLNINPPYMYKLANLAMEGPTISYDSQGYYQCAISISGYNSSEIRSAPVDVILPYTSNTKIRLNFYAFWPPEYLNQTSVAFLEFKNDKELYSKIYIKELAQIVTQNITGTSPKTIIQIIGVGVFTYGLNESLYITSRLTILGVNDSTKLQIYNAFLQNNNIDSFKQRDVMNIELTSLDYCPQSVFGEENYKGEYTFEVTKINYVVTKNCTYQSEQTFVGRCVGNLKDGPAWNINDLSRCAPKSQTTIILENLSKQMICLNNFTMNCSLLSVLSNNLSVAVANGSTITNYHDINLIAKTLETIINVYPNAKGASIQVFRDVLQTINNVLDSNEAYIAESQIKTSSSTSILNTLTDFALIYSKQLNSSISIGKTNIGFYIDKVKKSNIIISAQQLANDSVGISFNNNIDFTNKTYAIIKIPSEVFSNENEVIYSYFFLYDSFLLNEDSLLKLTSKNTFNKSFLQSTILSASVVNKNVSNLMNPIVLTFKKMHYDNLGTSRCSYWDKNIETEIQNVYGKWLTAGCYEYTDGFNKDDFFSCACNHLTNFALLLDVNQKSYNPLALSIITYIGCGVSLLGLSLTMFTLALFRKLRQKLPQKFLICLCASLSAFLIVFLIGAEKTLPRRGCQVFAALIHYFILSTFCWMLVEAFNLHRSLVVIFKKSSDSNIFRNANFFAWGVPVVIVVITAILKPDQLGNDKVCVVRGYPFYFAVLLPVCLILMVNFIVLISTMVSLSKRVNTANKISEKHFYLSQARIGFMCSTLLGSSWLFGVLAFKDLSTVFQWLFCISTSLQGCFIFVFYILRNKDVFVEWRLLFSYFRHYDVSSASNAKITTDSQLPYDSSLSSNVQMNTITK